MNTGAFGEGFPYSNFHDLNLDWIIKIAKDFLDQYTNIQTTIETGIGQIDDKTLEGLQQIADELALVIQQFDQAAEAKAAETIASIPDDYTALYNQVNNDAILVNDAYTSYDTFPTDYRNANNLPVNRVIGIKFGQTSAQQATMLNYPVTPFSGEILTINSTKSAQSFGFQLAINEASDGSGIHNKLFFRSRYTNWSAWSEIQKPDQIISTIFANAITYKTAYTSYAALPEAYRNTNNLPANCVIGFKFGWTQEQQATMQNFPITPFSGEILTINTTYNAQSFGFQLAINEALPSSGIANKLYFRSRYSDWTAWTEVTTSQNFPSQLRSHGIIVNAAFTSYDSLPTTYRDANELPMNAVTGFKFGMTAEQLATMSNFPTSPFSGEILTINSTKNNAAFGFQLAISEADPSSGLHDRLFFRCRYNYWTTWVEIFNPTYQNNSYKGLGNLLACGDSLTVSYSYTDATTYKTVKSWAAHLADSMGATAVIKAQGGITTGGFLNSQLYTEAVADTSNCAFVYLGTNDANQQVAINTFKTNYATLLSGLLTNHSVVFCIPLANATSPSNRATYNAAIKEVADATAGAYFVDMAGVQNQFGSFLRQGHLTSLGYAAFANAVAQSLNLVIAKNPLMIP